MAESESRDNIDNPVTDGKQSLKALRANGLDHELRKTRAYEMLFGEPLHILKLDRFTVLEMIGAGGMGEVYAAYDEKLDRKVAIKLMRTGTMPSERARQRLLREAKGMARVAHPNVVPVYDVGSARGRMFIAMEFVRGKTLDSWLAARGKTSTLAHVQAVLGIFIGAGRGLQAAHEAGIVHRDFKPANVLIGDRDERPRVVDFGLAQLADTLEPDDSKSPLGRLADDVKRSARHSQPGSQSTGSRSLALTEQGQILGTPLYMSPEQLRGEQADSRSDQFSFCVALYRALYGDQPFAGNTVAELRESMDRGEVREPARDGAVPVAVHRAIMRGLSIESERRFPSMEALLATLATGVERRSRRWHVTALLAALAAVAITWYVSSRPAHNPCAQAGHEVDAVWSDQRRVALQQIFTASSVPDADTIWKTVARDVDNYATLWRAEALASCTASEIHGSQSGELHDRRMACMQAGLTRLDTLLGELERGSPDIVSNAGLLLESLPPLGACQDRKILAYGLSVPDEKDVHEIDKSRKRLGQIELLVLRQRFEDAVAQARGLLATVEDDIDYRPLRAEALLQLGAALVRFGGERAISEGEAMLRQAHLIAVAERHDLLDVDIWHELVLSAGRNHDTTAQGKDWSQTARAAAARAGSYDRSQAGLAYQDGFLAFKDGRYQDAEDLLRQALAHADKDPTFPATRRAAYLQALGKAAARNDGLARAEALFVEAIDALKSGLGSDHPRIADARLDLATVYERQGKEKAANKLFAEILATLKRQLHGEHVLYGKAALLLAEVLRKRGALAEAMSLLETADRIYTRHHGADSVKLADVQLRLGAIAFRSGDFARAKSAYQRALDIRVAHLPAGDFLIGFPQASLAEAFVSLGEYDAALTAIDGAEQCFAARLKKWPDLAAFVHVVRGQALLGLGRTGAALAELERAESLHRDHIEGDDMARADAYCALARALRASGKGAEDRATSLTAEARAIYARQPGAVNIQKSSCHPVPPDTSATGL